MTVLTPPGRDGMTIEVPQSVLMIAFIDLEVLAMTNGCSLEISSPPTPRCSASWVVARALLAADDAVLLCLENHVLGFLLHIIELWHHRPLHDWLVSFESSIAILP